MDEQVCIYCTEKKTKWMSHYRKDRMIYCDKTGAEWSGSRCPDCYAKYKKEYDAKRRAKKGHVAVGTICVCSVCSNQYELVTGLSGTVCAKCRTTR